MFSYETRLGEAALMPEGVTACLGRRMALLRPDRSVVDPRFLLYLYLSPSFQRIIATNTIHGATVPRIGLATMPAWKIEIPDLPVQGAIAEVLGAFDNKISTNDKACNVSRELARSTFARAAHQGDRLTIRDVAQLVTRGVAPKYVESDGVIVLNQKCVRNQQVNLAPSRMTHKSSARPDKILQRDDVLVNSTGAGTLGRVARWVQDVHATVDSHVTIVRFDSTLVDPVCAGFGLLRIEKEIEGLAEGSTGQTELRRDLLAGLEIGVPNKVQQGSVGAELMALDELALRLQQESDMLAATRDELLPLLMSGKVRVQKAEKVVEGVV
ncbi:restriction endonuclease subunit S [Actinosynnema sp. NPDC023587]|uniref:restriction endonuclease subunit S n=1 Tax=Actinosynnema sp. NPDC023587 TaxID=3154695 RepID=UPI0033DEC287